MKYAKAITAILGAGLTAAIAIVTPGTPLANLLIVATALVTAAGVYLVPNASAGGSGVNEPSGGEHVAE